MRFVCVAVRTCAQLAAIVPSWDYIVQSPAAPFPYLCNAGQRVRLKFSKPYKNEKRSNLIFVWGIAVLVRRNAASVGAGCRGAGNHARGHGAGANADRGIGPLVGIVVQVRMSGVVPGCEVRHLGTLGPAVRTGVGRLVCPQYVLSGGVAV